jgi:hypothetical protein
MTDNLECDSESPAAWATLQTLTLRGDCVNNATL